MPCLDVEPLDVLVFLLDDLRFDQIGFLPETTARLADHAVQYDRAYVTTPMCCPERASFLSGGWQPQHVGVFDNLAPDGGATAFVDTATLPVALQRAGVETYLFGKYLNQYTELGLYVPPGWTEFAATDETQGWQGFSVSDGRSGPDASAVAASVAIHHYVTDWQRDRALAVLRNRPAPPQFIYLSFLAPHYPYTPAEEDQGSLAGFTWRGRAWEESDVSDKPFWIQALPVHNANEVANDDARFQAQLESLASVDRAMIKILDEVSRLGREDRTLVVLTSDNGMQWREHRLSGKGVGYEESVRIPLWIAYPTLTARVESGLVAMNLDIPATVADLLGAPATGEGHSLRDNLCDSSATLRESVVIQSRSEGDLAWAGVVTGTEKYIQTATGEQEFYRLDIDPYELSNVSSVTTNQPRIAELQAEVENSLGLAVLNLELPAGTVDMPYTTQVSSWGGSGALTYRFARGHLPPGLSFGPDGTLSGTPKVSGHFHFVVEVEDESVSPYHGGPQRVQGDIDVVIGPERAGSHGGSLEECGCEGEFAGSLFSGTLAWLFARKRRQRGK